MIRDIFIIIMIIGFVILSHIYIQNRLEEGGQDIILQLSKIKEELEKNSVDMEKIKKEAEKAYDVWKEKSAIWFTTVEHAELDKIEETIIEIKTDIQTGEFSESIKKIEEAKFFISNIYDKEKLVWKNIF